MGNTFLKTGLPRVTEIADVDTGEILERRIDFSKYLSNSREEFYMVYPSLLTVLKQSSDVKIKLFSALLEKYSCSQEFAMNGDLKKIIARDTGCSPRSFDNAMTSLLKSKMIVKVGSNLYKINPRHVFKGSRIERNKALKNVIESGCESSKSIVRF